MRSVTAEQIRDLPLFRGLPPDDLAQLAGLFRRQACPAACAILKQGQVALHLFILERGSAIIRYYPYDGGRVDLLRVRPGDIFGWSALLAHPYYTSAVETLTDSQVLAVPGRVLHALMRQRPALGHELLERLSQAGSGRLSGLKEELARLLATQERRSNLSGRRSMESLSLTLPTLFGDHHVIEVRALLAALPGVDPASIFASAAWQQIEIKFDPAQIDAKKILAALQARGYSPEQPSLPPVAARAKNVTEFVVGPAAVERFTEKVPAWKPGFGPCPGFEVLNPGAAHPADK